MHPTAPAAVRLARTVTSTVGLLAVVLAVTACERDAGSDRPPAERALAAGSGSYVFTGTPETRARPVTVWYHVPAAHTPDSRVLIVMHGASRNGDDYRDQWAGLSEEHGFLLIVPQFADEHYDGADQYNLGHMFDEDGTERPEASWSFSAIEPIFDDARARAGNRSARYTIYGHSAGSQFVHRFLMFLPGSRVEMAVAANAGWYTMPSVEHEFPYGLGGMDGFGGRSADEIAGTVLARPMIVLLGDADTDPNDDSLRRTPEAMAQGPHRFARGQSYFAAARSEAERLGVSFAWRLVTVPGVAHSNTNMAPGAVAALGW